MEVGGEEEEEEDDDDDDDSSYPVASYKLQDSLYDSVQEKLFLLLKYS